MTLIETTVGTLCGNDIGKRIALTFEGSVIQGTLNSVDWINYSGLKRGVECYRVDVQIGENSTQSLKNVPLDYRIQIERDDVLTTDVTPDIETRKVNLEKFKPGVYVGGSDPQFGIWRLRDDGVWLFAMPVHGNVWKMAHDQSGQGLVPLVREISRMEITPELVTIATDAYDEISDRGNAHWEAVGSPLYTQEVMRANRERLIRGVLEAVNAA